MSVAALEAEEFDAASEDAPGYGGGGPAPVSIVVSYGFWIFLLSDIVMFSALFAAYAVLRTHTAGGPGGPQLFDLTHTAIETGCLLLSSFTCGLMSIAQTLKRRSHVYLWAALTFALGAAFLGLEISEFAGMVAKGDGPARSAFLSAFFTLVGAHGIHVTCGLLWLSVMMVQVATRGFRPETLRRMHCFALFWHALDIIWVALFSVVYLMGAG